MATHHRITVIFLLLLLLVLLSGSSYAIPAFSRQYGTSCSTCHVDFPKLNDFGKAFKDAGFKFPKDDETFIKIPPVMLGAPAQKDLWPHTIFPGTIPGLPPIGPDGKPVSAPKAKPKLDQQDGQKKHPPTN